MYDWGHCQCKVVIHLYLCLCKFSTAVVVAVIIEYVWCHLSAVPNWSVQYFRTQKSQTLRRSENMYSTVHPGKVPNSGVQKFCRTQKSQQNVRLIVFVGSVLLHSRWLSWTEFLAVFWSFLRSIGTDFQFRRTDYVTSRSRWLAFPKTHFSMTNQEVMQTNWC